MFFKTKEFKKSFSQRREEHNEKNEIE